MVLVSIILFFLMKCVFAMIKLLFLQMESGGFVEKLFVFKQKAPCSSAERSVSVGMASITLSDT